MADSEVTEHLPTAIELPQASRGKSPELLLHDCRVRIESLDDIVTARQQARQLASRVGFSKCNLTLIATAISEIGRNAVEYAQGAEVIISVIHETSRKGVKIVVSDHGPGIADLSTVMRDGYSTVNRLGIGLPGTRRLMDEFEIASEVGVGTTVTMKKWAS